LPLLPSLTSVSDPPPSRSSIVPAPYSAASSAISFTVDPTNVAKVTLPAAPTQTNVIVRVTNDVPVIVQAVLGTRFLVVYPI